MNICIKSHDIIDSRFIIILIIYASIAMYCQSHLGIMGHVFHYFGDRLPQCVYVYVVFDDESDYLSR